MTPQTDTPTWQELASGFRKLAESKPAELPPMVANCAAPAELETGDALWTFTFAPDKQTLHQFKTLAANASKKAGDTASHLMFLYRLARKKPEAYHAYGEGRGYIENVCEVAAEWCAEQAEKAGEGRRVQ